MLTVYWGGDYREPGFSDHCVSGTSSLADSESSKNGHPEKAGSAFSLELSHVELR